RAALDAALRADLDAAGIRVLSLRLRSVRRTTGGGVEAGVGDGQQISAALLVDARGRSSFARRACAMRGPDSLALVQRWRGPSCEPGSQVLSIAGGWLWLARLADGTRYTQLSTAADAPGLPARAGLSAWLQKTIEAEPEARSWVEGSVPRGRPVARASTAWLHAAPCADAVLRVGDAAMAVDPLSGNGIFQALSSASVAPAVINSLLNDPVNAALALGFYRERLYEIFLRFARIGRDFHASETRFGQEAFWLPRAAWPDAIPAHAGERRVSAIARRAVVEEGWIRERELAITPEQPLGVWRVAGMEIVPWLRMPLPERGIRLAALDDAFTRAALGTWLRAHGELPD
ncbi:MAG: NAD(P)/FAD-dependent oxidoreductase, partial [Gammaproteobacteria bacterium]